MSKKNISRSALEGGRANYSRVERLDQTDKERARVRNWLRRVEVDSEYEAEPAKRRPVQKEFTDRLNPCWRWLVSRSGRSWDSVYSEFKRTFDVRTLSSWHIVYQHMLTGVRGSGTARDGVLYEMSYDYRRFFVDGDGILRDKGKNHGRFRRSSHTGPSGKEVRAKVGDRKVIDYGVVQYWAEPASRMWVPCKRPGQCTRRHRTVDVTPEGLIKFYARSESHRTFLSSNCFRTILYQHLSIGSWRQGKRFTPEEAVWWSTVSLLIRESVINSE